MPDPTAPLVCLHLREAVEVAAAQRAITAWRGALPELEILVAGPRGTPAPASGGTLPLAPDMRPSVTSATR